MHVRIKFGQASAFGTSNAVRENHTAVTAKRVASTRFFKTLLICVDIVNPPLYLAMIVNRLRNTDKR